MRRDIFDEEQWMDLVFEEHSVRVVPTSRSAPA